MTTIKKIALGNNGPLVSKLGLGCMRMSSIWGSPVNDESESVATIQAALDNGINFLNTGDFYGSGHNELLVGKAIKGRRDDAFISVKFGAIFYNEQMLGLDLRPVAIKNFINYSLVRLGIDTIDLYQPCRLDGSVPLEDVIGTVADLIKEGKVHYLGVSEITSDQLRKANSIHPVTALEIGYSLADRQIENELLPTAKELGIGVVAFANTAEGLLTGEMKAPLAANDYHNHFSRFQGENLIKNLEKVEILKTMAKEKGHTPTQLAIAWVNAQGDHIMPLVSMSRRTRLLENIQAMEIRFSPDEMDTLSNQGSRFDYSGIAILTTALFCLIYPLIEGREKGWPSWSIALFVASIGIFGYFVYNQKQKLAANKNPLIDFRLFQIKDFNIGLLAVLFHFMLHTAYLLLSAVYLQNGLGVSAMDCGLYFILPGVLFTCSSVMASKLMLRFGKRVIQLGALFMGITFLLQIALLKPGIDTWLIVSLMGAWGLGNGLVLPSLLNIALKSVPAEYAGAAAGVYSTFQQTASALGVSIIGGIFFYYSRNGWQAAYTAGLIAILVCIALVRLMLFLLPEAKRSGETIQVE